MNTASNKDQNTKKITVKITFCQIIFNKREKIRLINRLSLQSSIITRFKDLKDNNKMIQFLIYLHNFLFLKGLIRHIILMLLSIFSILLIK